MKLNSPLLRAALNTAELTASVSPIRELIASHALPKEQLRARDIAARITASDRFALFVASMNDLSDRDIYRSYIHGRGHLERVALFAFCIALIDGFSEADMTTVLEIAKYHDMGRINDDRDSMHGLRSARRYQQLNRVHNAEDLNAIKTVMAAHAVEDEMFDDFFELFIGTDHTQYERVFRLHQVIKDADALDRFRFGPHHLNVHMLRLETSRRLVEYAYLVNTL